MDDDEVADDEAADEVADGADEAEVADAVESRDLKIAMLPADSGEISLAAQQCRECSTARDATDMPVFGATEWCSAFESLR